LPVVSDSGALIHLAQTNQIGLLKRIFGRVLIVVPVKREVVDEGSRGAYPDAKLVAEALAEGYIVVHRASGRLTSRALKLAKQENISESDAMTLLLAKTLEKPLLTDEKVLSMLAKMYTLEVWNTWTILLEALRKNLIEKSEIHKAIDELGERRHKLSPGDEKQILDTADRIAATKSS
jgi:predicted nucleic acid-binding protein